MKKIYFICFIIFIQDISWSESCKDSFNLTTQTGESSKMKILDLAKILDSHIKSLGELNKKEGTSYITVLDSHIENLEKFKNKIEDSSDIEILNSHIETTEVLKEILKTILESEAREGLFIEIIDSYVKKLEELKLVIEDIDIIGKSL